VFNEAALVDLGDQGIRLCVTMPLADFGFSEAPDRCSSSLENSTKCFRSRRGSEVFLNGSKQAALPVTEGANHSRGHTPTGCGLQSGICLDGPKKRRNPGTRRRMFSADIFGAAITPVGVKVAAPQGEQNEKHHS
jgi:hypothetical protein